MCAAAEEGGVRGGVKGPHQLAAPHTHHPTISGETSRSGSFSTRPFIFVPLDSGEAISLPPDMSFRKPDRVIGQLELKILGSEIKDDTSTRKVGALAALRCAGVHPLTLAIRVTSFIACKSVAKEAHGWSIGVTISSKC